MEGTDTKLAEEAAARTEGTRRLRAERWAPRVVLGGLALAAVAAGAALANSGAEHRAFHAVLNALTVIILVGVGAFAWRRDPRNPFGLLLVAAGAIWSLVGLAASDAPVLYSTGRVAAWVEEALLVYLFLSYPTGRLTTAPARVVASLAVLTVAFLFVPTALLAESYPEPSPWSSCTGDCPANAFVITGSEPEAIEDVVRPVRELVASGLYLAMAFILAARVARAGPLTRRTLVPVVGAAGLGAVAAFVYLAARRSGAGEATLEALGAIRALMPPLAAVGFLLGLLAWQAYEARALERLALSDAAGASPGRLQALLAEALEDPTLELRFRANGAWQDAGGTSVPAPASSADRLVVAHGSGAIACDAALRANRRAVEAAARWVSAAAERRRLNGVVTTSLRKVEQSRRRLAAAAATERRRIERDLHDGAQQRLVTLRVQLELVEEELRRDPVAGAERLRELGPSVDSAIDEVRSLARGIYPPLLADAGVGEAVKAVALTCPVPVAVDAANGKRYPLEVESAVYFCCVEALQNAVKHAQADSVSIRVELGDDALAFAVRDDGRGFVEDAVSAGAGLTNMRDRIAALGGELTVESGPGRGTSLTGAVPTAALVA